MEELISETINTTIHSFDFVFCIVVNVFTYVIIKGMYPIKFTTWSKRLVLVMTSIILGILYWMLGSDVKVIINSIIIAPVSWSWIFKPICKKLNIDYKKD